MEKFLQIKDELHARPYIKLGPDLIVFNFSYLINEVEEKKGLRFLNEFLISLNYTSLPNNETKFWVAEGNDLTIRYECHTEFISLTLIFPRKKMITKKNKLENFFDESFLNNLPLEFLNNFPGQLFISTWIEMCAGRFSLKPIDIEKLFFHDNFAGSKVAEGGAKVFMSFRSDRTNVLQMGFRRVLIQNMSLRSRRTGRLLQRIVELETYQVLSLLGLPEARNQSKNLTTLEKEITEITNEVSKTAKKNMLNKKLTYPNYQNDLNKLSYVVAEIEKISSTMSYRLSATFAYNKLVDQRLKELREERLESFQTNHEFLSRRLIPAIRTCEAFSSRLESLAVRANRADNLVRTKIEMGIQLQNKNLLESMEVRARAQLRLQETVESLSLVAITYYIVGLISYFIGPLTFENFFIDKNLFLSLSVPVVLIFIWLTAKFVKRKIHNESIK